jgi:hypothetical protein
MKKLIATLLNTEIQSVDKKTITVMVFDIIAIIGGLVFVSWGLYEHPYSLAYTNSGAALLGLGIMTKVWKKEFHKKN